MSGALQLASLGWRRGQRAASALILVVIALAAATIAAAASVGGGAASRVDDAFAAGGGPDLVVFTGNEDAAQVERLLAADPDVRSAPLAVPDRSADLQLDHGTIRSVEQRVMPIIAANGPRVVGRPVLDRGRFPTSAEEVALDDAVAWRFGIAVGDEVSLTAGDGRAVRFRVAGTAHDFSDCFYPNCDPGRTWTTSGGLARLGPPTGASFSVRLTEPARAVDVERRLADAIGDDRFGANTWPDTRGDLLTDTDFFAGFLQTFGAFAVVASGFVIAAGTVARAAANRRRTGLCHALGATPRQLMAAQVLELAGMALVGSIVGGLLGALVAPRLRVGALRVVGGGAVDLRLREVAVIAVVITVVVALVAAVPAWRASREAPVAAIDDVPRTSRAARRGRRRRGPHPAGTVGWGVRTFAARPFRAAMSVGATALAVVAAVVTLSIDHAIDRVLAHPSLSGDPYDATFEPADPGTAAARLDALSEVGNWFTTQDETVDWDGGQVHARALGGDPRAAGYDVGGGRRPSAPGEAIVAYGLVDEGISLGGDVTLHAGERTATFTIVGWYRDTEDSGRIIALRDRPGAPLFGDVDVTYQVTAAPGVGADELSRALASLGGTVRLNRSDGAAMAPFRTAMAAMTALLAAVALAHLLATALATARERARSTAIMRAVGASGRQLSVSAAVAGACAAGCALVVGLPLGLWLQRVLGDVITSSIGIGPGAGPQPPLAAIAAAATLLALLCVLSSVAATAGAPRRHRAARTT
jgi:putative ABC transport system permease protein